MQDYLRQLRTMEAEAKATAEQAAQIYEDLHTKRIQAEAIENGEPKTEGKGKVIPGPWAAAAVLTGAAAKYLFGDLRRTALIGIATAAALGGVTFAVTHKPYYRKPAPDVPAAVAPPPPGVPASPRPAPAKRHRRSAPPPAAADALSPTTPAADMPISTPTPNPLENLHQNPHGTPPGRLRKPPLPPTPTPTPPKTCPLALIELVCELLPNGQ